MTENVAVQWFPVLFVQSWVNRVTRWVFCIFQCNATKGKVWESCALDWRQRNLGNDGRFRVWRFHVLLSPKCWVCVTECHSVSQCITECHSVSQCITVYHSVSQCVTVYHRVSQCITVCLSVSQSVTVLCDDGSTCSCQQSLKSEATSSLNQGFCCQVL